jgi:hypothetical protein
MKQAGPTRRRECRLATNAIDLLLVSKACRA